MFTVDLYSFSLALWGSVQQIDSEAMSPPLCSESQLSPVLLRGLVFAQKLCC